jgi:Arc/MetJ family transcription regulator
MKRTTIVIDEKLIKAGLKATGLKTHRALVDYALRDLLRRESQESTLELKGKVRINELERKHREGYKRKPFKQGEFWDWEAEQVWMEA